MAGKMRRFHIRVLVGDRVKVDVSTYDLSREHPAPGRYDLICCRNVIIYFDRPTQERLISRFCSHLAPGGYLFMGHSETLSGLRVPLASAGPMVYRRTS